MKMSNTNNENRTLKKAKKARAIPGFGLTMGVTVTMLSLIVLIPLASVFAYALKLSPNEFFTLISKETVRNAFILGIERVDDDYLLRTGKGEYKAHWVINAAGLGCKTISDMLGSL